MIAHRAPDFHHFGLGSRDGSATCKMLGALGYETSAPVRDPLQRTDLIWCVRPGAPPVEIVLPIDDSGPLKAVLAQQQTSFYHLCFECHGSLDEAVAYFRDLGTRIVTVREPLPAVLFGGRRVSFHMAQGFGLIELLEKGTEPIQP